MFQQQKRSFCKMASTLCKKNQFFCQKSSKFWTFQTIRFDSNIVALAFATEARKSFNEKFTTKIDFSDRAFHLTVTDPDIGSLKSLKTLFDNYLDHILLQFEQNRMVWNIQTFGLFVQEIVINHFWESVDAIFKTFDAKVYIGFPSQFNTYFMLNDFPIIQFGAKLNARLKVCFNLQITLFNFNNCSSESIPQSFSFIKQAFNRHAGSIKFI